MTWRDLISHYADLLESTRFVCEIAVLVPAVALLLPFLWVLYRLKASSRLRAGGRESRLQPNAAAAEPPEPADRRSPLQAVLGGAGLAAILVVAAGIALHAVVHLQGLLEVKSRGIPVTYRWWKNYIAVELISAICVILALGHWQSSELFAFLRRPR